MKQHKRIKVEVLLIILCLFSFSRVSYAQETCNVFSDDVWYFGTSGAGIIFNEDAQGEIKPSLPTEPSKVNSGENSLSVSAPGCGGSLIFYSQHNQLYNARNEPMPNGSFSGNTSVADGLAACYIGNNQYMLFAVNYAYNNQQIPIGLDAHVIDMSLENGLGDRVPNRTVSLESSGMSESIELVPRTGTDNSYWLIYRTYPGNQLLVREINNGVIGAAISYTLPIAGSTYIFTSNKSYTQLALMYPGTPGNVVLIDFNPSTGVVGTQKTVPTPNLGGTTYGVAFSPNERYLYATGYSDTGSMISQYDLQNGSWTAPFTYGSPGGGMKVGPDGKLYVMRYGTHVGVIAQPDQLLTSNGYNKDGFYLGPYTTGNSAGLDFSTGLTPPAECPPGTNQSPVAEDDHIEVCAGSEVCISVLENDWDPDGDIIRLDNVWFSDPNENRISLSIDKDNGIVCVKPEPWADFLPGEQITILYRIKDNSTNPIPKCDEGMLMVRAFSELKGGWNIDGPTRLCKEDSPLITLTGEPVMGGTGAYHYQWEYSYDDANWQPVPEGYEENLTATVEKSTYFRRIVHDMCGGIVSETHLVLMVPEVLYWSKNATDRNWNNPANWEDEQGNKLHSIPYTCSDVHIPGNAVIYPDLDPSITPTYIYGNGICRNITFHFGSEVAKHNYLTYEKAYIQYNFGYYQGNTNVYRTDGDPHSATPMQRNRWYALAAPLKKIASGDFSVGGYPNMWQQGFKSTTAYDGSLVGDWYSPVADIALPMESTHHGISIWAARMQPFIGENKHENLNALKGIIELPYFENPTVSTLHRIHTYANGISTFQYYDAGDLRLTDSVGTIARQSEAYRFVFDNDLHTNAAGELVFKITVPAGENVMIGNPFLSSLDFNRFYNENAGAIENYYRLYEHPWVTFSTRAAAVPQLIPSFQSFFVKTLGIPGSTVDLYFPVSASVTRSGDYQLKLSQAEENIFTSQVRGPKGNPGSVSVVLKEDATIRNVPQMFVHEKNDPEAAELPQLFVKGPDNSLNVIYKEDNLSSDVTLTLGVRSTAKEEFTLSFDNLNNLSATDIRLKDNLTDWITDLKNTDSYTFTHDPEMEDRFELSILGLKAPTGIEDNKTENVSVNVYAYERTVRIESSRLISKVSVYGTEGLLLNSESVSGYIYSKGFSTAGLYIVSVELQDGTKEVKKVILK